MPTSPNRSALSEHSREPIQGGTLGYIRARAKRRMFTFLIEQFEKSGISQAQLSRRLNMDRARVSKYLGTPSNWEFETLCDLFFAITGGVFNPELAFPIREGAPPAVIEKTREEDEVLENMSRAAKPPSPAPQRLRDSRRQSPLGSNDLGANNDSAEQMKAA